MKKILLTILLSLFFSNSSYSQDFSTVILDKLFQEGTKICKEEGYGEYLLRGNPVKLIDISNDGIKDLIVDESVQICQKSASIFAGGTGGNNFLFFINPTIDNVKAWDASGFGGDKENRIYSMLIRNYEIVKWKNKNALKVQVHGVSCNVSGAVGCYNILVASAKGIKKVEGPTPNEVKKIRKKANEVEIVQGYEGILQKQVKDKANALMKNYNAELFDLINKKDTARNILKHREFEYALSKEINEKWIDFHRKGKDQWSFLNEKFYHLLNSSSKKANEIDINNDDFFIVTGCVDISCDEGALLYVDKKNKVVIGSIVHKFLSIDNLTEVNSVVMFSKKIDLFKELPKNFWHRHVIFQMAIYNLTKRKGDMIFIGSDNKDTKLTQLEILTFDGK